MLLVVWAASFGLNECGLPEIDQDTPSHEETSPELSHLNNNISNTQRRPSISLRQRKSRKVDAMLREILELIDFHGVMRRPTWDGVRVLLLVLPLMEGDLICPVHQPHRAHYIQRPTLSRRWPCSKPPSLRPKHYVPSLDHRLCPLLMIPTMFSSAHRSSGTLILTKVSQQVCGEAA